MEEWNMLAADCVVVSCCCQCLVLQILVLLLRKMVRKTREYGKKLFCKRRRNYRGVQREIHENSYKDVLLRIHEQSIRIQEDMELKDDDVHNCGYCMVEVEKVMEELCEKGEFGFGSFWGRKEPWGLPKVVNDHNDDSFGRYQIIELGCT
ncbi:hypothetical protein QL285_092099 [Trifolium repens]|nr:hypothetical protein QL285_092099 [Trifolium repens]